MKHVLSSYFLVCLALTSGCSEEDFSWVDAKMTMEISAPDSRITYYELMPTSYEYTVMKELVLSCKGSWERNFITYAPQILVSCDSYNINLLPDQIVINYTTPSGKFRQIVTKPTGVKLAALKDYRNKLKRVGKQKETERGK